jgi:hypothetical protein
MNEQLLANEAAMERLLRELAPAIVYPPTPDLAASVRGALLQPEAPRSIFGWRPLRRSFLAAVIALLLLAGAAVAVGIGLRGLSIVFVDETPGPVGRDLRLGEPVTLAQARDRVAYEILLPSTDRLGEPGSVYVDERTGVQQVSLVYRSGGLTDDVGLLITQFVAQPGIDAVQKDVGPGTQVEHLTIGGQRAFWITGEPHVLSYLGPDGEPIEDEVRLVGDVLLWQRGDVSLRLEGAGSRAEALEIARSMR